MELKQIRPWLTPAAVALVIAALVSYTSFSTGYSVMAAQVEQNTTALAQLTQGLLALANDKMSELEGKLAVLRYISGQNGGLDNQQQLEYDRLTKRLKDLR